VSSILQELGIGTTKEGKLSKGGALIVQCTPGSPSSISDIDYDFSNANRASKFVSSVWANVELKKASDGVGNSVLGSAFECLLALVLCIEEIGPFFMQAELTFVPNAKFDILMYDKNGFPISLSIKTSLRERYKQADLEAMALKQVHRNSESYLITLNELEAAAQSQKIEKRELVALDKIILATSKDFDELILDLKARNLVDPDLVPVIRYRESEFMTKSILENEFTDRQAL
jgi:hypothetical protein